MLEQDGFASSELIGQSCALVTAFSYSLEIVGTPIINTQIVEDSCNGPSQVPGTQ